MIRDVVSVELGKDSQSSHMRTIKCTGVLSVAYLNVTGIELTKTM